MSLHSVYSASLHEDYELKRMTTFDPDCVKTQNLDISLSSNTYLKMESVWWLSSSPLLWVLILSACSPIIFPSFYLFDGNVADASTLLGINGTICAITGLLAVSPLTLLRGSPILLRKIRASECLENFPLLSLPTAR